VPVSDEDLPDSIQQGPPQPGSQDESQRQLAVRLARSSRRLGLLTLIGGLIVAGGLVMTYIGYLHSNADLEQKTTLAGNLQGQVSTQKAEVAKVKQQAGAAQAVLSELGTSSASGALNQAFAANPDASKLIPRVYIHMRLASQRAKARALAGALRQAGFVVVGMDVQKYSATAMPETEVHYYLDDDGQTKTDVAEIEKVVGSTGIPVAAKRAPNQPNLQPRAYGLWLASGLE
jgi:hypothetical protein